MSDKAAPTKSSSIPAGTIGLALAIIFCIEIALSANGLYSVLLGGALGLAGLVISIVGIAKGSGRVAGVFGIVVFILGCLMTFATILDIVAFERVHSG